MFLGAGMGTLGKPAAERCKQEAFPHGSPTAIFPLSQGAQCLNRLPCWGRGGGGRGRRGASRPASGSCPPLSPQHEGRWRMGNWATKGRGTLSGSPRIRLQSHGKPEAAGGCFGGERGGQDSESDSRHRPGCSVQRHGRQGTPVPPFPHPIPPTPRS